MTAPDTEDRYRPSAARLTVAALGQWRDYLVDEAAGLLEARDHVEALAICRLAAWYGAAKPGRGPARKGGKE